MNCSGGRRSRGAAILADRNATGKVIGDKTMRLPSLMFLTLLAAAAVPARGETPCKAIPPIRTLVLRSMYSDAKSSVVDAANEADNARSKAPIFDPFRATEHALDQANAHPGVAESDCAFRNFSDWARAGALTFEPPVYDGQGKVTRGLLNPSFQMIAIKFRAAGYVLDPTMLAWLRKMNDDNVAFYVKGSNRANQRVWAAAGAALNDLVERNPASEHFADQVWHKAIAAIRNDGLIEAELTRGQQALVYHMYSLSATLVLEAARRARGVEDSPQDKQRLDLLISAIGRALCDQTPMAKLAGTTIRVPDGEWAYEVINGLAEGRLDSNWSRCGLPPTDVDARDMGGDSRRSVAIFARMADANRGPAHH
jgi:poly(beta-D-mannuronate) lyase